MARWPKYVLIEREKSEWKRKRLIFTQIIFFFCDKFPCIINVCKRKVDTEHHYDIKVYFIFHQLSTNIFIFSYVRTIILISMHVILWRWLHIRLCSSSHFQYHKDIDNKIKQIKLKYSIQLSVNKELIHSLPIVLERSVNKCDVEFISRPSKSSKCQEIKLEERDRHEESE